MNEADVILLNNFMQELEIDENNSEVNKLVKKLDLITKQILLQQNFQKEMQELNNKIDEI